MKTILPSVLCVLSALLFYSPLFAEETPAETSTGKKPNILWLTCEDIGRHLGCYDFPTAQTPNLDKLAQRGMKFMHAWSNYPVCAPARTTIITGCYSAALGAEQMRSYVPLPKEVKMYPHYLRQAGYYCTNNNKTDYNAYNQDDRREISCWDVSNKNAHWKNRKDGQPFFAIFNFVVTHESQIRNEHKLKRNPDLTPVPKYHPNVPEIRRDWTQYHERITEMDAMCGEKLKELDEAGLTEDTIVFFFGDHGSGMPRNKRTPLDCGLGVPFLVYFPPKYQHLAPEGYKADGTSGQLISFVDLAPTLLSIAGVEPPAVMQGIPFAGKYANKRDYVFGFRGRMDERADLVRSVSDGRYVYVRNYHPEIFYGSRNDYMFQTRSTQVWRELYDAKKLPPEQSFFWKLKPIEELYDLRNDKDEINNLADKPEYSEIKQRLKTALRENILKIRDVHFMPENMLHARFGDSTPWEFGHNEKQYPLEKILDAAEMATDRNFPIARSISGDGTGRRFWGMTGISVLSLDTEPAVRYWAITGMLLRLADTAGEDGTQPTEKTAALFARWKRLIEDAFNDNDVSVQIVAAEILGRYGDTESDVRRAAVLLLQHAASDSPYTAWYALEAFDRFAFRCKDKGFNEQIEKLNGDKFEGKIGAVFPKIIESIRKQIL
ncbi:MAG: sulfatase [Planctomycetaceae bacterium]|nr:sulfatase [Planctomycetaceae bacterium]